MPRSSSAWWAECWRRSRTPQEPPEVEYQFRSSAASAAVEWGFWNTEELLRQPSKELVNWLVSTVQLVHSPSLHHQRKIIKLLSLMLLLALTSHIWPAGTPIKRSQPFIWLTMPSTLQVLVPLFRKEASELIHNTFMEPACLFWSGVRSCSAECSRCPDSSVEESGVHLKITAANAQWQLGKTEGAWRLV